jgi:hypothetical protein
VALFNHKLSLKVKKKYPHCDSNAGFFLRREALYPLSYGGVASGLYNLSKKTYKVLLIFKLEVS